jgi:alpha-galactosidase
MTRTLAAADPVQPFHAWAPRPPMGWNSWDCFATTVSEAQVKAQADYLAQHLAQYGWRYVVVDIQWYEPDATGFQYRVAAELTLDEWGRLLPAPQRFPSSREGAGFKPLADYVHARGLAFGLHLLRGIPRQAVARDLPVFGSSVRASQIARTSSVCAWNPDMYGVDMAKPGAQAYYDSVFGLFAAWGVDYVKVDDISRPYHDNEAEIEAIRRAIDRTGRPMVLSLSPGATALSAAAHVQRHANLWRISDDFWDDWVLVREQFARLAAWNPHRGPGYWPDADMLPFGVLDLGRRSSRLSREEQRTVMTLWAIARSPLMHGGDMTRMDEFTLSLLSNAEVIAVNQASLDNLPLFDRDGLIAWLARPEGSADRYLALFNARDPEPPEPARQGEAAAGPGLAISVRSTELGLEGAMQVRDLWRGQDLGRFDAAFAATVPWHGARLFRISGV